MTRATSRLDDSLRGGRRERGTVLVVHAGADRYGSDLQVLESVAALLAAARRVDVVLPAPGPLVRRLTQLGATVTVVDFPVLRRSYLTPGGLLRLAASVLARSRAMYRLVAGSGAEVVYVNTTTMPWWVVAARLARVPSICHVHEAEGDSRWLLRAMNSPMLLADLVVVNSESARHVVVDSVPALRHRVRLIYNGVPDRLEPAAPLPPAPPTRLSVVGRLSPRKAQHVALAAAALLVDRGYDVRLEIAGTCFPGYEWYVEELRAQAARPPLAGRVDFTGYADPVFPVYDRSHLVLAPSLRESFGNVVVEAQLSGRPVVATASTGHTETVESGRTGLLVPPGDAVALAEAVAALLDDPNRSRELAEAGARSARDRFGISRYRQQVCQAIESVTS